MARRKTKRAHKRRVHKKRKHSKAVSRRSGMGKSSSTRFSIDSVGKMIASSLALRFGSGLAFWLLRRQGMMTPKTKILVPGVAAFLAAKGIIPKMDGFLPMAVDQTVLATVENFTFLRDLADFRFLDKKPAGVQPTAGYTPRTYAQTRAAIRNMHNMSGLTVSTRPRVFSGYAVSDRPRTFSGTRTYRQNLN